MWQKLKLPILLLCQTILILLAFKQFIFSADEFMFQGMYDGLKNYFTFYTYLSDGDANSLLQYSKMNYPYGEYVFYTDQTPFFSVPLKFISQHIVDLSPYGFTIYNSFIVFSILFSSFFLVKIGQYFLKKEWLIFLLALCLPWIHPQSMRLINGHYNLSFAWIFLGAIYLLLKFYDAQRVDNLKKLILTSCLLMGWIIMASFIHLYYLALVGVPVCIFIGLVAISQYKDIRKLLTVGSIGIGGAFLGFLIVLVTIKLTDGYYDFRKPDGGGYGWEPWKLTFSALFRSQSWHIVKFLLTPTITIPYESYSYQGGFALYGCLFLTIGLVFFKTKLQSLATILASSFSGKALAFLLVAGIVGIFISLGDTYVFGDWKFQNYFNPFYYLQKITVRVKQFRCLARFSWFFFWAFNFLIAFVLDYYLRNKKHGLVKFIAFALVIFLATDAFGFIRKMSKHKERNNLVQQEAIGEIRDLTKDINFEDYQAILSVPFFHVGAENLDYTIDPEEWFFIQNCQLSILSDLPLICSKMSRAAIEHPKHLWSMVTAEKPDNEWLELFTDKPVLVLHNKSLQRDDAPTRPKNEVAKKVYDESFKVLAKYKMDTLVEKGNLMLLSWEVKAVKR